MTGLPPKRDCSPNRDNLVAAQKGSTQNTFRGERCPHMLNGDADVLTTDNYTAASTTYVYLLPPTVLRTEYLQYRPAKKKMPSKNTMLTFWRTLRKLG